MSPAIPSDHLVDPRIGYLGFRQAWTSDGAPAWWVHSHRLAERGGYLHEGRQWRAFLQGAPILIPCLPTRVLYRPLIDRITAAGAMEMGWTVDA